MHSPEAAEMSLSLGMRMGNVVLPRHEDDAGTHPVRGAVDVYNNAMCCGQVQ